MLLNDKLFIANYDDSGDPFIELSASPAAIRLISQETQVTILLGEEAQKEMNARAEAEEENESKKSKDKPATY